MKGKEVTKERNRGTTTICPACGDRCYQLRAQQITPTFREVTYSCRNPACDHVFIASVVPMRVVHPSRLTAEPANSGQPLPLGLAG